VRRTADGFEVTVGTNHLGHFLLANLLLPDVAAAGPGARVVVTASEVHDPASPGGAVGPVATLGDLSGMATAGAAFEMIDGSPCVTSFVHGHTQTSTLAHAS
jgi:protochlorophyllide reductase